MFRKSLESANGEFFVCILKIDRQFKTGIDCNVRCPSVYHVLLSGQKHPFFLKQHLRGEKHIFILQLPFHL